MSIKRLEYGEGRRFDRSVKWLDEADNALIELRQGAKNGAQEEALLDIRIFYSLGSDRAEAVLRILQEAVELQREWNK